MTVKLFVVLFFESSTTYDLYIDTDLHAGLLLFNLKKPE